MRLPLITLLLLASSPAQGTAAMPLPYQETLHIGNDSITVRRQTSADPTEFRIDQPDPNAWVELTNAEKSRVVDMLESAVE